jgi:prepilin signal peptidase PulO-like enzyme (type II secretory pathway)
LSIAYLGAEITAALLFISMLFAFGITLALIPALLVATLLTALLAYDIRHTILPDVLLYPFVLSSLLVALLTSPFTFVFLQTLLAALVLSGLLAALWFFSKGRAIGLGDAKLTLGLALLTGYPASVSGFMLSFWIGAIVMLSLMLLLPSKLSRKSEIPFAPFLVLGFLVPLVSGWTLPLGI